MKFNKLNPEHINNAVAVKKSVNIFKKLNKNERRILQLPSYINNVAVSNKLAEVFDLVGFKGGSFALCNINALEIFKH